MQEKDTEKRKKGDLFLSSLRVLDLADEKASFCSRLLADLGADVIKLERPGGKQIRKNPTYYSSFLYHNRNKRGITLDLNRKRGRDLFLRLVKGSDIIIESFALGSLEEWGLEYGRLKIENPAIIHVKVSDFGSAGPRSQYKSCDLVASACGGHMAVTGSPQGPPLRLYGKQSYYSASLFAACTILLAIIKRNRTGEGDYLEITLHEAVTSTLEYVMVRYFSENLIPGRTGGEHWNDLFFPIPCKDGFIQMSVFQHWETLVELMERDGAVADLGEPKWKDEKYRRQNKDHALLILKKWAKRFTRHELFEMGQAMRFPWAPVQSPKEILSCPHLKARGFFYEEKSGDRSIPFPGLPFRLSTQPDKRDRSAPAPGEHNLTVYRDELGIDEMEIRELASEGII